jgi:hypothetical protein
VKHSAKSPGLRSPTQSTPPPVPPVADRTVEGVAHDVVVLRVGSVPGRACQVDLEPRLVLRGDELVENARSAALGVPAKGQLAATEARAVDVVARVGGPAAAVADAGGAPAGGRRGWQEVRLLRPYAHAGGPEGLERDRPLDGRKERRGRAERRRLTCGLHQQPRWLHYSCGRETPRRVSR